MTLNIYAKNRGYFGYAREKQDIQNYLFMSLEYQIFIA